MRRWKQSHACVTRGGCGKMKQSWVPSNYRSSTHNYCGRVNTHRLGTHVKAWRATSFFPPFFSLAITVLHRLRQGRVGSCSRRNRLSIIDHREAAAAAGQRLPDGALRRGARFCTVQYNAAPYGIAPKQRTATRHCPARPPFSCTYTVGSG